MKGKLRFPTDIDELVALNHGTIILFDNMFSIFLWAGILSNLSLRYKPILNFWFKNAKIDEYHTTSHSFYFSRILGNVLLIDQELIDDELIVFRDEFMNLPKVKAKLRRMYKNPLLFRD